MVINLLKRNYLGLNEITKQITLATRTHARNVLSALRFFSITSKEKSWDEVAKESAHLTTILEQDKLPELKLMYERTFSDDPNWGNFKDFFVTTEYYPKQKLHNVQKYLEDLLKITDAEKPFYACMKLAYDSVTFIINSVDNENDDASDEFFKHVEYGASLSDPAGTLHPTYAGIPQIPKDFHYYLFSDLYKRFELTNSHPAILLDFAHKNYLSTPTLKRLVHDKESLYQEVMSETEKPRDFVTKCFLYCIYDSVPEDLQVNSLLNLQAEMEVIRETLYEQTVLKQNSSYKDHNAQDSDILIYLQKYPTLQKQKVSLQCIMCYAKESSLILSFLEFLQNRADLKSFIPLADGGCLVIADDPFPQTMLADFNRTIKPLSICEKEILPGWSFADNIPSEGIVKRGRGRPLGSSSKKSKK